MISRYQIRVIAIPLITAMVVMAPLFYNHSWGPLDFWWSMACIIGVLIFLCGWIDNSYLPQIMRDMHSGLLKKVTIGVVSAALLFMVFHVGNLLSRYLFSFAAHQIDQVYQLKLQAPSLRIFLLMVLVIGPGEELFWRGFVQKNVTNLVGPFGGLAMSVCTYTAIHIASGNLMLILAALVCGLAWGWLYMHYRSITMNIISHTVWDVAVFLIFPFTTTG